jgi:2-iminobutanoate/2-iminopropanoate deaminase
MKRTILKAPEGVANPGGHYSHGVIVEGGRTLYAAGQVPLDENGNLVAPGDVGGQTRQALENLRRLVEAAGGSMDDIAKTTVFVTSIESRGPVGEARKEFFKGDPPANTFLVISSLADPGFLVEIEAIVPLP